MLSTSSTKQIDLLRRTMREDQTINTDNLHCSIATCWKHSMFVLICSHTNTFTLNLPLHAQRKKIKRHTRNNLETPMVTTHQGHDENSYDAKTIRNWQQVKKRTRFTHKLEEVIDVPEMGFNYGSLHPKCYRPVPPNSFACSGAPCGKIKQSTPTNFTVQLQHAEICHLCLDLLPHENFYF